MGLEPDEPVLESLMSLRTQGDSGHSLTAGPRVLITVMYASEQAASPTDGVFGLSRQPQGGSPLGLRVSSVCRFLPRLCCFPRNRLELFPGRKRGWLFLRQTTQSFELNE